MRAKVWAGIDAGDSSTNLCVIDAAGRIIFETACPSDPAVIANHLTLADHSIELIAIEGGVGLKMTRDLRERGFPVEAFEARTVRRFLSVFHNKTDASDARGLAEIGRIGRNVISRVHVKSPEFQSIRTQLSMRKTMLRQRVATEGIIRSLFRLHFNRPVSFTAPSRSRAMIEAACAELSASEMQLRDEIAQLLDLWDHQRRIITMINKKLVKLSNESDTCRRLQTIVGVGPILALSFYSAVEDPHRFARIEGIGAYFGLAPRLHQSGSSSRKLGISKRGNVMTRSHLILGARSLMRATAMDSHLKQWGNRLGERVGYPRAKVAVARKLAIIMLHLWRTGATFQAFPHRAQIPIDLP